MTAKKLKCVTVACADVAVNVAPDTTVHAPFGSAVTSWTIEPAGAEKGMVICTGLENVTPCGSNANTFDCNV